MKKPFFIILFVFTSILISAGVCSANSEYNGYIVKLKSSTEKVSLSSVNNSNDIINGALTVESLDDIPDCIDEDDIEYIEPNYIFTLSEIPNDPDYSNYQWYLETINASSMWETGCYGNDIKIAVIDSGVSEHNDLKGNILEGCNLIDNSADTTDTFGHGTFVSGLIAAVGNNSINITGLAYRAKIVPLKCFSEKTTETKLIADAIKLAVDKYECKIINISAGSPGNSNYLYEAVEYACSKGAIIIAASGNHGTSNPNRLEYPASYDNTISVGSINRKKTISESSNYNEKVDITAPGEGMVSLAYDSTTGYKQGSGTSYATPLVSAAAAMCLNINPDMDFDEFKNILQQTAEDLGDIGKDDYYGYGMLDLNAIVEYMLEDKDLFISPYDFEDENPSSVTYNNTESTLELYSVWKEEAKSELYKISVPKKSGEHIYYKNIADNFTNYLWELNLKPLYSIKYSSTSE